MSLHRVILIFVGVITITIQLLLRRKKYKEVAVWKVFLLEFNMIIAGVIGAKLLYIIENGEFGGSSLFGAILFVPVFMLPSLLFGVSYKDALNLCAPSGTLMLAIMKFECWFNGCCFGKYLPSLGFQFPSQIIEAIFTLLVMMVLLIIENRAKNTHLYAWYLILYGITRFLLNGFRYGLVPFIWNLSAGHFWSIFSVIIGVVWLICVRVFAARRKTALS